MLSAIVLYSLFIWFIHFLVKRAKITESLRNALGPLTPKWAKYSLKCALCTAWWITLILFVLTGFSIFALPFLLCAPPMVLLIEKLYGFLSLHSE